MNSPHEKAVQAILYGHSCAMRLKLRLNHPISDDGPVSSYDLAKSVVDCFSSAISILSDKPKTKDDKFSDLSSWDSSSPSPQGSPSKKRKIDSRNSSDQTWRDDSPDPIYYDGYLWRKYGQKCIKKSDHQRSYYRCSYNKDHNCRARKHEQKIKDNPPVYRTTYFGQHTCKTNLDAIFTAVKDPVDDLRSDRMIRFGKDLDEEKESHSSGFSLSAKHDEEDIIKEETMEQYREILTDDGQDCQHVMEDEDLSSPSGCYPPSSSSSEIAEFISDLLFENPYSWDRYDHFDFGLP